MAAQQSTFRKGVEAYDNFEYHKSLKLLERALNRAEGDAKLSARILVYMGIVRYTIGDKRGARSDFERALKLDYTVSVPPDISPKIVNAFQSVKKAIPPPRADGPQARPPGRTEPPAKMRAGRGTVVAKRRPAVRKRIWTWIALGVGAAVVAGGGVMAYLASDAKSAFDGEPFADRALEHKSTAESRALAANVLFGAGAAAMVTGLVLFFVEGAGAQPGHQASLVPRLVPAPGGLQAVWRY